MSPKFTKFLMALDKELRVAKSNYEKAKISAQEVAASAALSPSQAGDRFHSQGTADLAKQRYDTILDLKKEIEEKGESICYEFNGEEIFLVDSPVVIKGFKLVSTGSPIGQKLSR